MKECIIQNAYCTPRPCVHCLQEFCAHEHPEKRAFGAYGQYCSRECRTAHMQQVFEQGAKRFELSRVVLVMEEEYCYLVCNRHKREKDAKGYGFKILQQSAKEVGGKLALDYCHFPGFSIEDHPVTYEVRPHLQIMLYVYDEYNSSVWTMLGFRLLENGAVDTFGVGGSIVVIDER